MFLNREISNISVECFVALKIALLYRLKRFSAMADAPFNVFNQNENQNSRARENSWRVMKFPQRRLYGYLNECGPIFLSFCKYSSSTIALKIYLILLKRNFLLMVSRAFVQSFLECATIKGLTTNVYGTMD